jgi:hypothetical protein
MTDLVGGLRLNRREARGYKPLQAPSTAMNAKRDVHLGSG